MYSKKFDINTDMPAILKWLHTHNVHIPGDDMPETGIIAQDAAGPIACVFLRKCEGGYAQVDGMTSNPERSPQERDAALHMLTRHIEYLAKRQGIRKLIAFSIDKNTLLRSYKHGYVSLPHTVIVKDL